MAETYANSPQDTLNGGIDASTLTVVLNDASEFSSTGTFRIIIESEILRIASRSGNTLTVAAGGRGAEGTTAASHSTSTAVAQVLTRDGLQALIANGSVRDTRANLPAASLLGRVHRLTD